MSRPVLSQRNPNRLAVEGLNINVSVASVEILQALYTLKRAGWVNSIHGWNEGTVDEINAFWREEILEDTPPGCILEEHIMKRKNITKIDSLIAEAQVFRCGRWVRTPMGGWRRVAGDDSSSDSTSNKENSSFQSNSQERDKHNATDASENDETLVDSSTEGPDLIYHGTKRAFEAYEVDAQRRSNSHNSSTTQQPPLKRKKTITTTATGEPKRLRVQPNVNMDDYDVSSIHLDDEDDELVPVFDTCDDIRSKINVHLTSSQMTRAAFMRLMCSAGFPLSKKTVQDRQLANFQAQKGARRGCESNVYYAAYVYFEKLRVKRAEGKGQKRLHMEEIWGEQGIPRKIDRNTYVLMKGDVMYEDEYGVRNNTVGGLARDETIAEKASRNRMMDVVYGKKS